MQRLSVGTTSDRGRTLFVRSRDECAKVADVMFQHPLVTKQTGEQGQRVSKVLVQEAADIAREIYLGMVVDRAIGLPVLMACAEGGVEIEEVAARSPELDLSCALFGPPLCVCQAAEENCKNHQPGRPHSPRPPSTMTIWPVMK